MTTRKGTWKGALPPFSLSLPLPCTPAIYVTLFFSKSLYLNVSISLPSLAEVRKHGFSEQQIREALAEGGFGAEASQRVKVALEAWALAAAKRTGGGATSNAQVSGPVGQTIECDP